MDLKTAIRFDYNARRLRPVSRQRERVVEINLKPL